MIEWSNVVLLLFYRDFYTRNKHLEELKIKDLDETDSGYFAVEFEKQWHRVEPYDTRMGEAIRVSMLFWLFCCYSLEDGFLFAFRISDRQSTLFWRKMVKNEFSNFDFFFFFFYLNS